MLSDERIRQIADDIYCSEGTRAEIEHSIRAALAEAAQVPVMGEAVAEAYVYEDVDGDDILGLRLLKEDYPMQHGEKLYIEPTTSIPHAELDAKDARIAELEGALQGLLNIVNDSYGVDGYHLNGDVAHWSSFDEVAIAEAAIAKERQS